MQRKRLHKNPIMAFVQTIRNFLLFGKVVLDKFAMFAGNTAQFKVNVRNQDMFSQGAIIQIGAAVASIKYASLALEIFFESVMGLITEPTVRQLK